MKMLRNLMIAMALFIGLAALGSAAAIADDSGLFGFYLSGTSIAPS